MIIGYDFFGKDFHGNIFDTAISTSELDEVTVGAGLWDEIFVSVDTTIDDYEEKPDLWQLKTIMDAKFQNNLEAGSFGAGGNVVDTLQLYRRDINKSSKQLLVGMFPYNPEYNVYSFVDRLAENLANYEYSIVPIAGDIMGDLMKANNPAYVEYDGVFLSNIDNNFKIEFDIKQGSVTHNTNFSEMQTLNGRYPIIVKGNQNYRTGNISFLPVSDEQISHRGRNISPRTERELRDNIVKFLQSDGAKLVRNSSGDMKLVAVHNVQEVPREGVVEDLSDISFDYVEVGKLEDNDLAKNGLLGRAGMSKYTFDEDGNVIWNNGEVDW